MASCAGPPVAACARPPARVPTFSCWKSSISAWPTAMERRFIRRDAEERGLPARPTSDAVEPGSRTSSAAPALLPGAARLSSHAPGVPRSRSTIRCFGVRGASAAQSPRSAPRSFPSWKPTGPSHAPTSKRTLCRVTKVTHGRPRGCGHTCKSEGGWGGGFQGQFISQRYVASLAARSRKGSFLAAAMALARRRVRMRSRRRWWRVYRARTTGTRREAMATVARCE